MRFSLLIFLLLGVSVRAQQPATSQQAASAQPASDPQAVAVVQAAITALGGAAAISQSQSWTFHAQMRGAVGSENISYAMSTDTDTGSVVLARGITVPLSMTHSYFVPALVGAILLKESQDPIFSIFYGGTSTLDSKPVTVIVFTVGPKFPAQVWYFDVANLPVQVDFRLSAEIGTRKSVSGRVLFSGYFSVSGVLYPSQMTEFAPARLPEIVTLQSVSPSATISPNEPNASAGDSR